MTEDNMSDLGKMLKQRRISMGLNLKEIAVRAGVSSSHLGRIERGERIPSATILRKIAEPLGFEEKELLIAAQYLPSQETSKLERLAPSAAMMLSQEPIEVQRAVIGILSILKTIARGLSNPKGLE